jgi:membrane protein YdbS with pleckstrin-like domain
MTYTEDNLLDRLNGQTKLTLLWQLLACFTSYLLTAQQPWFWIPVTCAALAVVLSAIDLLWILPRWRRAIWESATPNPM